MLRNKMLKAVIAASLTLGFAAAADQSKTAMQDLNPPYAVFLVSSSGIQFCDYFLITQNGIVVAGQHVLSNCGLGNALVSGSFNLGFGAPPYGNVPDHAYNINSTANCPDSLFYLFDTDKGTWANYGWDGNLFLMFNSGTFYTGAPPAAGAASSGKPSTQKQH